MSASSGSSTFEVFKNDMRYINSRFTYLLTDEKVFTVATPKNPQNDRVYAPSASRKRGHGWTPSLHATDVE